ncbi:MAG TPA: hypothetical protein VI136_23635, partial [Verrucomicrobiae bacterium]
QHEQRAAVVASATPAPANQTAAAPETQPAPLPQMTSQPCANSTYYWTPRPQIPDAPRVPDAPTF